MEAWAEMQRSKLARRLSFLVSALLFFASLTGAVWFGFLALMAL